jgi:protein-tyrosine kinase
MSLVEQALKKLQAARAAGQNPSQPATEIPKAPTIFGRVVETPPVPGESDALPRVPRSNKTLVIDKAALRAAGLLAPESQERQIADEYRQIKRPLIARVFGRGTERVENGHLIMMASAAPGDGKTFTSINLALSMALEKDVSVLLVDADVAKPHISTIFGVNKEPGLLDVLRDESLDVESVILPTNIPRLSMLPAGTPSETATEMLASARMRHTVARLAAYDPNRIVLLDSPPLLLTSESRVLANIVGQIVMVVCAGRTPQRAVFDALDLLGEGRTIGLVFNQSDERSSSSYRYEYYGQGLSGGSQESPATLARD